MACLRSAMRSSTSSMPTCGKHKIEVKGQEESAVQCRMSGKYRDSDEILGESSALPHRERDTGMGHETGETYGGAHTAWKIGVE